VISVVESINITFNDQHIPESPFNVMIRPDLDLSHLHVSGNGIQPHGVFLDSTTDITLDAREVGKKSDARVTCLVTNPSGARTDSYITKDGEGVYKISYTPFEEGQHTIEICYDGIYLAGSNTSYLNYRKRNRNNSKR
jgi:filamin